MKAMVRTVTLLIAACWLSATGFAQYTTMPLPEDTLTVSASGTAETDPDWIEVSLTVSSSSTSAETAVSMNLDNRERVRLALLEEGVAEESISIGPPQLAGPGFAQMARGETESKWRVISTITLRFGEIKDQEPGTVHENLGRLIDVATSAGAATPSPDSIQSPMSMVFPSGMITYGADDESALREKAIGEALQKAKAAAKVAAERTGKKLGPLSGLQITDLSGDVRYAAMMGMFSEPSAAGMASVTLIVSATHKVEEE